MRQTSVSEVKLSLKILIVTKFVVLTKVIGLRVRVLIELGAVLCIDFRKGTPMIVLLLLL